SEARAPILSISGPERYLAQYNPAPFRKARAAGRPASRRGEHHRPPLSPRQITAELARLAPRLRLYLLKNHASGQTADCGAEAERLGAHNRHSSNPPEHLSRRERVAREPLPIARENRAT